jgi:hypothetical protein
VSFKVIYEQGIVTATIELRTNHATSWEKSRVLKFIEECNHIWADEAPGKQASENWIHDDQAPEPETSAEGEKAYTKDYSYKEDDYADFSQCLRDFQDFIEREMQWKGWKVTVTLTKTEGWPSDR